MIFEENIDVMKQRYFRLENELTDAIVEHKSDDLISTIRSKQLKIIETLSSYFKLAVLTT